MQNGRPIPDWPWGISLNALISIYSVIIKGTIMVTVAEALSQLKWSWYQTPRPLSHLSTFDLASRGTWGSLQLIARLRGLHLASLGAAITILSMASDPFVQQVVHTYPCPQKSLDNTATVYRVNQFGWPGIHSGAGLAILDNDAQIALYQGAYNSFSPVRPSCVNGNCTFPNFRTSAMCNECHDVSNLVNMTQRGEQDGTGVWQLPGGLNITIPTDAGVMTMGPTEALTEVDGVGGFFPYSTDMLVIQNYGRLLYGTKEAPTILGVRCSLYPCVRTYSTNVSRSEVSETVLATRNMSRSESILDGYDAVPMPCLINGTYYNASALASTTWANPVSVPGLLDNKSQTMDIPRDCFFAVEGLALRQFLPTFLVGSVHEAPEFFSADPFWLSTVYRDNGATSVETINATWATLADSMTWYMREMPDESNLTAIVGEAWRTETCISVQWAWLAFPTCLVALSIVFLVATVMKSNRCSAVQIWKSSPLALLFSGLNDELRDRYRGVEGVDDMDLHSEHLLLKLEREGAGFRFVEAS